MMNDNGGGDDFAANPFRGSDVLYDATSNNQQQGGGQQQPQTFHQPNDPFQPQPQPPSQQSQQQSQQQQPPPLSSPSSFPPPSGPMDNMNFQQQTQQQSQQQQRSGLMMSPTPSSQPPPQQQMTRSWWGNVLLCINLDSYRMYFDIDADDIITRIRSTFLSFYKPEHFRLNVVGVAAAQQDGTDPNNNNTSLKGPDLYGPFWITMTLIFFLGVTANLHAFFHHSTSSHKSSGGGGNSTSTSSSTASDETIQEEEFDYDINHLLHAGSICIAFAFVLPTILWMTTYCCMSMKTLQLVDWVCLYGYSLVPYLPTVIVCIIPFGIVSWILLAIATTMSCLLVVRNVAHPLLASDVGQAKAPPIILVILGTHIIFFLFLKFRFFHYTG